MKWLRKNIIRPIKNLIRWFPIIWNDKDTDDYYIWCILSTKLKHQADFFDSDKAMSVGSEERANRMRLCVRLIDLISNETYCSRYMDELDNKDYINKHPHAYKEVMKGENQFFGNHNDVNICMNIGYYMHNKARRILFRILEQNGEDWWD